MDPYDRRPEGYETADGRDTQEPAGAPAPAAETPPETDAIRATSVFCGAIPSLVTLPT